MKIVEALHSRNPLLYSGGVDIEPISSGYDRIREARMSVCLLPGNFVICFSKQKVMAREFLNDFEELILTMVAALGENAYGASITIEIEQWIGRKVTLSAVHVILYRLEDNGYIKSIIGGSTNERGGRRKRIYSITNSGLALLRSMKETRTEIWKMVPQLKAINN